MTFNTDELDTLAICSMRYALGRQSYIVGVIADLLIRMRPEMNEHARQLVAREIGEALDKSQAGHPMDVREWRRVLETHR